MNTRRISYILGLVLAFAVMLPVLHADEANQATQVTFNQPVQIPGRTLPAGSYWIQRADAGIPEVLRIFNADRSELIATLFTISTERKEITSHAAFVLADSGAGKAQSIVAWFYPGRTFGHEFIYAQSERQELARDKKETVVAGD